MGRIFPMTYFLPISVGAFTKGLSFQDLGWLPRHETPFTLPGWMGAWFEMYSSWETLGIQVLAALFVVGSYKLAQELKVKRPQRTGFKPAVRAEAPPRALAES